MKTCECVEKICGCRKQLLNVKGRDSMVFYLTFIVRCSQEHLCLSLCNLPAADSDSVNVSDTQSVSQSTTLVQTEISQQLLDALL